MRRLTAILFTALAAMMLCIPAMAETSAEAEAPAAEKKEKASLLAVKTMDRVLHVSTQLWLRFILA